MRWTLLQSQKTVAGCLKVQTSQAISPLPLSTAIFDVLVDGSGEDESGNGKVPSREEHEDKAEEGPKDGHTPVVKAEPWPPVGCLQEGLQGTRQVDNQVFNQEKHGYDGSYVIHTSYQHAQLCQGHGQEEGKGWLSPEPHGPKYLEKGNEVVIGDGLQDTWCTRQ